MATTQARGSDSETASPVVRLVVAGVLGFGAALAAGLVFGLVLADLDRETLTRLDRPALEWIVDLRSAALNDIARVVTTLASSWVVTPVVVCVSFALLYRRRVALAAFVVAATAGTSILTSLAKSFAGRDRPPPVTRLVHASGAAFPSGHSSQALAVAVSLAVVVCCIRRSRRMALLAFAAAALFAFAVGATRVYLGVHWPIDVVGGWLLATAWLSALGGLYALAAFLRLRARRQA